jgi:hypothetical protein
MSLTISPCIFHLFYFCFFFLMLCMLNSNIPVKKVREREREREGRIAMIVNLIDIRSIRSRSNIIHQVKECTSCKSFDVWYPIHQHQPWMSFAQHYGSMRKESYIVQLFLSRTIVVNHEEYDDNDLRRDLHLEQDSLPTGFSSPSNQWIQSIPRLSWESPYKTAEE